jgi:hypothetical protein
VLFGQGHAERSALLLGAAAAVRAGLGTSLPRAFRSAHDRAVAALRESLGDQDFSAAWEAGAAMSLDVALDHALSVHGSA